MQGSIKEGQVVLAMPSGFLLSSHAGRRPGACMHAWSEEEEEEREREDSFTRFGHPPLSIEPCIFLRFPTFVVA